ncbi:hypothetical protein ACQJBY_009838 [Aegilops geniculata]
METPPPPPALPSVLSHLRSLLSAASSALSSVPSPLLACSTTTTATIATSSTLPATAATTPLPSLPSSPTSEIPLPLPAAPAPYHDCPAVVRTTNQPPASSSLPAFLAAECADFASSIAAPTLSSPPRILPSELCLLRREVDSWGSHRPPGAYSYAAARVVEALRLGALQWEVELRRWLLASSPKYGIVIDAASRDHVFVLVRLCLKAAAAEAGCSLERLPKGEGEEFRLDPRAVRFECPRLVDGVSWLASQLEVLYGKGNGWFFAITAVKEAILRLGSCLAVGVGDGVAGGASEKGCELRDTGTCPIFVSQVAAAIAALHDRLSLDKKIRALQAPRPSKYQLLLEYSQILKQGCDERSKRPNCRAVLDYDGILPRQMDNQESGRSKTREELLAEERDYKRRRMSYRGKKMKRNPTEILRDIIDEHMAEIKQAGLGEPPGDIAQNILETNSNGGAYQGSSCDKAILGSRLPSRENSPHTASRSHDTRDSYMNIRYENSGHHHQNVSEHEKGGIRESGNAMNRGYSDRHDYTHKRNTNDHRKYGNKYKKNIPDYHSESSDRSAWSTRTPKSSEREYGGMPGDKSNDRTRTTQNRHGSIPGNKDQFSDRYDPKSRYSDEDPREAYHDA